MKRALCASVVAVVVAPSLLLHAPAGASCAAPELVVRTKLVEVGEPVRVAGSGFTACADGSSAAPSAPVTADVGFVQGDRRTVLATVTPDGRDRFRTVVTVPGWARPGPAEIDAPPAEPVPVTVMSEKDPFVPLSERTPAPRTSRPSADDTSTPTRASTTTTVAASEKSPGAEASGARLAETGAGSAWSTMAAAAALLLVGLVAVRAARP